MAARSPAVDSNVLTYLLDAVQDGYHPSLDRTDLVDQRVAMLRCFFYGDCSFWVPPTVQAEYARIHNTTWRTVHDRWTKFLLQDMPLNTAEDVLEARALELEAYHPKHSDCRVVAETECAGLDTLLSCDSAMLLRFRAHTRLQILKPTEFWEALGIGPDARPIVQPANENPLALQDWWRL